MKIAFYTSTLGDQPIEEVARFAQTAGFDALELDIRRHIPAPDDLARTVASVRAHGLDVCAVTLFGNQLDPDQTARADRHRQTRLFAAAASSAGVPAFVVFPGRSNAPEADDYQEFAAFAGQILAAMSDSSTKLLMENWPGPDRNFIATTPGGWTRLFELVADRRLGLEFDPSHLLWQGIDPIQALVAASERVGLLHAKDTIIDRDRLQDVGHGGRNWWRYALPGRGQLGWREFLQAARRNGIDTALSVEHEDADFGWPEGPLEPRLQGLRESLAFLRGIDLG